MNNKLVTFKGEVDEIVYYNEENGYCIFDLLLDDSNILTCTGTVFAAYLGEKIKVTGTIVQHKQYGKQLKIEYYEKEEINSQSAMKKYLASGIFKGIGEKTAEKIVDRFKEETFNVIENDYERLTCIKGVTYEKALNMHEEFVLRNGMRNFIMAAQRFEISIPMASKIYEKYKDKAMDVLENNPYKLIDEVDDVNFKFADKIALKGKISNDNIFRIEEGIRYALKVASNNGHCYLPQNELINNVKPILEIYDELKIIAGLDSLIKSKKVYIVNDDHGIDKVYLKKFYFAEKNISDKIRDMLLLDDYEDIESATTLVTKVQKKKYEKRQKELVKKEREINHILEQLELQLSDEQYEAVLNSLSNEVNIITGGPGTGKTTIINVIVKYYELNNRRVTLVAPTGRAAKRMTEATRVEASTIHRLLEVQPASIENEYQNFLRNEDNPLDTDVIIVDEMSMVDVLLFNSFLKAVEIGTKLILVGDEKQLSSVGPGNVLKDLIYSKKIKTCFLTQVFRQAEESKIIKNAHLIRNSKKPDLSDNDGDFFFIGKRNENEVEKTIIDLITNRLPKYLKCAPCDIQILSPMKKGKLGTQSLNEKLQSILNPDDDLLFKNDKEVKLGNRIYRVGDKVMQIKNNYDIEWKKIGYMGLTSLEGKGVFNGDTGRITSIDNLKDEIVVRFDDDKEACYQTNMLDELDLAYAITIHKSQGSEYNAIIIPTLDIPEPLMNRNLLYTGITRAKNLLVLVGSKDIIYKMIDNDMDEKRYSNLKNQLIYKINND